MITDTYDAVRACTIALHWGAVLQIENVTAGRGQVIDWRTVRSGETLLAGADAYDTARMFVSLVGPEAALLAATRDGDIDRSPPPARVAPRITAFMQGSNGGRRRQFDAGEFTVVVEPHEDDEGQAAFTARLAALCGEIA